MSKPRRCRQRHANGFMTARDAALCSSRTRATAASIARLALCLVHRYRKAIRAVSDIGSEKSSSRDWAGSARSYLPVWVLPKVAIVATVFASVPVRTAVWVFALAWMGFACILNSRRCRRVHCRYTGPYYLALTIPVLLFGTGTYQSEVYAWIVLGVLGVFGGVLITWATEAAWGQYENNS